MNFQNYALGDWVQGDGEGISLHNAISGDELGKASSKGLDFNQMMNSQINCQFPLLCLSKNLIL